MNGVAEDCRLTKPNRKWQFIVPRSGTFLDQDNKYNHGPHKMIEQSLSGTLRYQSQVEETVEDDMSDMSE